MIFMLEDQFFLHNEVMSSLPTNFRRYLYPKINWKAKGICIVGDRGVGKTTLLCQNCTERYQTPEKGLYISADHISVLSYGLVNIAKDFYSYGGETLFIDEVHKYPNWSIEIKNILDTYKTKQVIFSASSSLDLNMSKGDLSRRVVYHRLLGLSFREYLLLSENIELPLLTLSEILDDHVKIATVLNSIPVLKHFNDYLKHGYYPFFIEGLEDYISKIQNVIEKVLFEDIAVVYNLKQTTVPNLKRILWLVATSNGLTPNIDKMSKNLGISRETIYECLDYLSHSGLLMDLYPSGRGNALVRKPGKIYLNNANLLNAIHGSLKLESDVGGIREAFFVNQVSALHKVALHDKGDFIIDEKWIIEVGGKGKNGKQIKGEQEAYLAVDGIKIGFGKKIPLYLFGLLY
ncbi:MAG: ATP-binding protein [Verrucomicrobia bacterium]|nr:ATP-binding protein [Verrucomicrobiota bacterium]